MNRSLRRAASVIALAALTAVGAGSADPLPATAPDAPQNARVELVRVGN